MTSTGNQDRPLFADMDETEASTNQGATAEPRPTEPVAVDSTEAPAIPLGAPEPRDEDRGGVSSDPDAGDPRGR